MRKKNHFLFGFYQVYSWLGVYCCCCYFFFFFFEIIYEWFECPQIRLLTISHYLIIIIIITKLIFFSFSTNLFFSFLLHRFFVGLKSLVGWLAYSNGFTYLKDRHGYVVFSLQFFYSFVLCLSCRMLGC